ncbi:MAG TPA: hypothetical protein VI815_02335 [Candidatus Nanoarchaeia archaeon]|nr:hypothetical protein [Candidatus Nanoarchaeia archaeon]
MSRCGDDCILDILENLLNWTICVWRMGYGVNILKRESNGICGTIPRPDDQNRPRCQVCGILRCESQIVILVIFLNIVQMFSEKICDQRGILGGYDSGLMSSQ